MRDKLQGVDSISCHLTRNSHFKDEKVVRLTYPDSKVNGANMGPIWGQHVGPMNLVIWVRACWFHCICAISMPNFIGISFKQAPWLKFDFLKIVVGRGQENIGAAMFSSPKKLIKVSLVMTSQSHNCLIFEMGIPIPSGAPYSHGSTLIQAWISNYMSSKVWDEIMYPLNHWPPMKNVESGHVSKNEIIHLTQCNAQH